MTPVLLLESGKISISVVVKHLLPKLKIREYCRQLFVAVSNKSLLSPTNLIRLQVGAIKVISSVISRAAITSVTIESL